MKRLLMVIAVLVVVVGVAAGLILGSGNQVERETPTGTPTVIVQDYDIYVDSVGVDKVYLSEVSVALKNDGDASATITQVVISSNGEEIRDSTFVTLDVGEEEEISCEFTSFTGEVAKAVGVDQITATITILGYPEGTTDDQIMAVEDIAILIPTISIGGTIPQIAGKEDLSLTLLSWEESDIAVDGPYADGYYTFTAQPGMKFVILMYKFENNGIREQETPYINAGEIATNEGYIYSLWNPPLGVSSEEYDPRKATEEEVDTLIGASGGYEDLLPEESTRGCVAFEIPTDAAPIEATIVYVSLLIKF